MSLKGLLFVACVTLAIPVQDDLASMDLSLTVFDQHSAKSADASKNYIIFAFDNESCSGANSVKCAELESALNDVKKLTHDDDAFAKYREHVSFGKANKDDFPEHQQDFEKAKIQLPAVLFWPAGHSRPSCKYSAEHAKTDDMSSWLQSKLKDEDDDDLLELDEGASLSLLARVDPSVLVCQADGGPNVVMAESLICSDLIETGAEAMQGLVQLEKTQRMWKNGESVFVGPADNSLNHGVVTEVPVEVRAQNLESFRNTAQQGMYQALYFHAPWCKHCNCLDPVWNGVASNLVGTLKQPELVVAKVDGDANADLRDLFQVTAYPTFVVVNKQGDKVLGRYLGPRKVFELSLWIEDLIVADENPIVKTTFSVPADQGTGGALEH